MALNLGPRFRTNRGVGLNELMVTTALVLLVLGIVVRIVVQSNDMMRKQRTFGQQRENIAATLDMITRLTRSAQTIHPDPDGDGVMNSIRLIADWNPRNGVTTDPYEDIIFSSNGQQLMKKEPTDGVPVAFAERVTGLTFAYFDTNNVPLTNPVASASRIAYVNIGVLTGTVDGLPGVTMSSAATVRRAE